jgi:hypothetical protein
MSRSTSSDRIGSSGDYANTAGAGAAFKGYRRQLTYTLLRILRAAGPGITYQPEGVEDLAIWRGNVLVEACQVKALAEPLNPSHLRSRDDSFFRRAAVLLRTHPEAVMRIASFGPIGPDLERAAGGDSAAIQALIGKLIAADGLTPDEARAVIGRIRLEKVEESQLIKELTGILGTLLTGADPKASLDLLHWWTFRAAEGRRELTASAVRDQVVNTGKYVTAWWARNAEWFTNIEPLGSVAVDEGERDRLATEFYQGIAARPEHVAAGLDIQRPEVLAAIDGGFGSASVVVVRGASGEGKSTVALRYLHQLPEPWRFRIRRVDDRAHAARIAVSLLSHAEQIGLPLIVWIDVAPSGAGWAELVARLTEQPTVRVLVSIREEDWRRTPLPAAAFEYVEIELRLGAEEARSIFSSLVERRAAPALLDFADAWRRFGSQGPLLEFVHLVTQAASLRERLAEQVARLEDEVRGGALRPAELELLRLVAVASAYEAQVDVVEVASALGLPAPRRTIDRFEDEYLLRTSTAGRHLQGLHPIRSEILVDLLCEEALSPWLAAAQRALPMLVDEDREVFLMSAFVDRPSTRHALREAALGLQPGTWTALAGVGKALLWLGIAEHADRNRPLLDRLIDERGDAALLLINWDIAGASASSESIIDRISELMPKGEQLRSAASAARQEQTPADEIWSHLRRWLAAASQRPLSPRSDEWSAVGEVCFWAGRLSVSLPLADWLEPGDLVVDEVSLEQLADVTLGFSAVGTPVWFENRRSEVLARFQRETLTVRLADDGEVVRADFFLPLAGSSEPHDPCGRSTNPVHDETMHRVWLLRRLFPERGVFACQGYGHRLLDGQHDSTTKRIPKENLPLEWLTSINATFAGYLELPTRPRTWDDVAGELISRRKAVLDALAAIERALARYHRSADDIILGRSLDLSSLTKAEHAVGQRFRLPVSAVDPWGLATEGRRVDASQPELGSRRSLALDRYRAVVASTRDWNQSVENFLRSASQVLATAPLLARRAKTSADREAIERTATEQGIRTDLDRLSRLNLRDAAKHLRTMQREVRDALGPHLISHADASFDSREREAYLKFATVWEFFLSHPAAYESDVVGASSRKRTRALQRFTRGIAKVQMTGVEDLRLRVVSTTAKWCTQPVIAVAAETTDSAFSLLEAADAVIDKIAGVARDVGGDLSRELLSLGWPSIMLIWLFRGRALDRNAFRLDTEWLQRDERPADWWRFVPIGWPDDFAESVALLQWTTNVAREGTDLVSSVADVWAYAAHLADLVELGEIDGEGERIIQGHLAATSELQSTRLQSAIDALDAILQRLNRRLEASGPDDTSVQLFEAIQELHAKVLPPGFADGSSQLRLSEITVWRDAVADARTMAVAARLLAATLFMREEGSA